MYDCSKEFEKYYSKHVVLSNKEQSELRDKRDKNIKRLKDGLKKYNEEKNESYKISETRTQGSMAMHTIVQNDDKDYDIDVAIVFESDNLDDLGPQATRNIVANALKKEMYQFSKEPEVKTGCVRVHYTTGYHIDFAIFKRYKEDEWGDEYIYEHAGSKWEVRDIKALDNWFDDELNEKGNDLRKIVRFSKMFCKSRDTWGSMPSGLIQTVLCSENFDYNHNRLDEKFYYTIKLIVERLTCDLEVEAPVDNRRKLTNREVDSERLERWKNKLKSKLEKIEVLLDDSCTYEDAISAWYEFFNHSYWEELLDSSSVENSFNKIKHSYNDIEEYIEEKFPAINEKYYLKIDCRVEGKGISKMSLDKYLDKLPVRLKKYIPHNFKLYCSIADTNCPSYDRVLWKVRNVGSTAERKNCIRGQIEERGNSIVESTSFHGAHYIECYLMKNNTCVAIGHVDVPIGDE